MTPVTDIVNAIVARVEAVTSFSKLPYAFDIEKNSWQSSMDGFAVRPSNTEETTSVTKRLTYIQSFEVVLTKGYTQSAIDDSSLQSAVNEISDLIHSVFVDLEQTRAGIPATVLNVLNLTIEEPSIYETQKVVALTGTVNILYRLNV